MKYKLHEVIEKLNENNHLTFTNGETDICLTVGGYLTTCNSNTFRQLEGNLNVLDSEWEIVKKPVKLEEVLKSDKRCMLKHPFMDSKLPKYCSCEDQRLKAWQEAVKNNEYTNIDVLLSVISWNFGATHLRQIIQEGEWYLED